MDTSVRKHDLDRYKRRLIRTVARLRNEGTTCLFSEIEKIMGTGAKKMWKLMRSLALKKITRLLSVGDVPAKVSPSCHMTVTDWLLVDLVLVHEDVDTINTKTESPPAALERLFDLVQEFNLENCPKSELAASWYKASTRYNRQGRQCSPMLLQRRWYDLKAQTRSKFYQFWEVFRKDSSSTHRPAELHRRVAAAYREIITCELPTWSDLVSGNSVVLLSEFEKLLNVEEKPEKNISDESEDVVLIEPVIECIDVDLENELEAAAAENEMSGMSDEKDDLHANLPIDNDLEIYPNGSKLNCDNKQLQNQVITKHYEIDNNEMVTESTNLEKTIDTSKTKIESQEISKDYGLENDQVVTESNNLERTIDSCKANIVIKQEDIEIFKDCTQLIEVQDFNEDENILETQDESSEMHADVYSPIKMPMILKVETLSQDPTPLAETVDNLQIQDKANAFEGMNTRPCPKSKKKSADLNNPEPSMSCTDKPGPRSKKKFSPVEVEQFKENESQMTQDLTSQSETCIKDAAKPISTLSSSLADIDECSVEFADEDDDVIIDLATLKSLEEQHGDTIKIEKDADAQDLNCDVINSFSIELSDDEDCNKDGQKFDLKLLMLPVVYTQRLNEMEIFQKIPFTSTVSGNTVPLDIIEAMSKPENKEFNIDQNDFNISGNGGGKDTSEDYAGECLNNSDSEEYEEYIAPEPLVIKNTSYLFHKPKTRNYTPINLCKNPDFNTRLRRVSVAFLMSPRNRQLLKSIKPLTIDVHKAFEEKLVNGMVRINQITDDVGNKCITINDFDSQSTNVVPTLMPAQCLIDKEHVHMDTLLSTQRNTTKRNVTEYRKEQGPISESNTTYSKIKPTNSTECNKEAVTSEPCSDSDLELLRDRQKKSIQLPDRDKVRQINKYLKTAQVPPLTKDWTIGHSAPSSMIVSSETTTSDPSQSAAMMPLPQVTSSHPSVTHPLKSSGIIDPETIENKKIYKQDIKNDAKLIGENLENKKKKLPPKNVKERSIPWYQARNANPEVPWYQRHQTNNPSGTFLLKEDSLQRMINMLGPDPKPQKPILRKLRYCCSAKRYIVLNKARCRLYINTNGEKQARRYAKPLKVHRCTSYETCQCCCKNLLPAPKIDEPTIEEKPEMIVDERSEINNALAGLEPDKEEPTDLLNQSAVSLGPGLKTSKNNSLHQNDLEPKKSTIITQNDENTIEIDSDGLVDIEAQSEVIKMRRKRRRKRNAIIDSRSCQLSSGVDRLVEKFCQAKYNSDSESTLTKQSVTENSAKTNNKVVKRRTTFVYPNGKIKTQNDATVISSDEDSKKPSKARNRNRNSITKLKKIKRKDIQHWETVKNASKSAFGFKLNSELKRRNNRAVTNFNKDLLLTPHTASETENVLLNLPKGTNLIMKDNEIKAYFEENELKLTQAHKDLLKSALSTELIGNPIESPAPNDECIANIVVEPVYDHPVDINISVMDTNPVVHNTTENQQTFPVTVDPTQENNLTTKNFLQINPLISYDENVSTSSRFAHPVKCYSGPLSEKEAPKNGSESNPGTVNDPSVRSILSELMEISGISSEDTPAQVQENMVENISISSNPTVLTPITNSGDEIVATSPQGKFYMYNTVTGAVTPITVVQKCSPKTTPVKRKLVVDPCVETSSKVICVKPQTGSKSSKSRIKPNILVKTTNKMYIKVSKKGKKRKIPKRKQTLETKIDLLDSDEPMMEEYLVDSEDDMESSQNSKSRNTVIINSDSSDDEPLSKKATRQLNNFQKSVPSEEPPQINLSPLNISDVVRVLNKNDLNKVGTVAEQNDFYVNADAENTAISENIVLSPNRVTKKINDKHSEDVEESYLEPRDENDDEYLNNAEECDRPRTPIDSEDSQDNLILGI